MTSEPPPSAGPAEPQRETSEEPPRRELPGDVPVAQHEPLPEPKPTESE